MIILSKTKQLLFPEPPQTFYLDTAVACLTQQRTARIAKAAIYSLATLASAITLSFTSFIAWPITATSLVVAIVSWALFYRLHTLDNRYIQGLNDETRTTLAKKEIHALFCEPLEREISTLAIEKTLNMVNHILGYPVFSPSFWDGKTPLPIECAQEWEEKGYFGLPSLKHSLHVHWSGKPSDPIEISKQIREITNFAK